MAIPSSAQLLPLAFAKATERCCLWQSLLPSAGSACTSSRLTPCPSRSIASWASLVNRGSAPTSSGATMCPCCSSSQASTSRGILRTTGAKETLPPCTVSAATAGVKRCSWLTQPKDGHAWYGERAAQQGDEADER